MQSILTQGGVRIPSWYRQEDLKVEGTLEAHQATKLKMRLYHPWTSSSMILCKLSEIRKFQLENLRKRWRSTKLLVEREELTPIYSKQMILSIVVALWHPSAPSKLSHVPVLLAHVRLRCPLYSVLTASSWQRRQKSYFNACSSTWQAFLRLMA